MGSPLVLMLSGGSSAGKTTLAKALLDRLGPPAVLIEGDRAFPLLPSPTIPGPAPPVVVFHRSMTTWLSAGFTVVVDGSLPYGDDDLRDRCLSELPSDRTFIVGVACSVPELRRREQVRPDQRLEGWAERQADDVNAGLSLLTSIDTSTGSTLDHVDAVLRALAAATRALEPHVEMPQRPQQTVASRVPPDGRPPRPVRARP